MTYRERRLAKAERLRNWANGRDKKSAAGFKTAATIADGIPFGQPILVGHHSERHHRRDIARIDNGMRAGVENAAKANGMRSRADNIEFAVDASIYMDDHDAVERLQAKIAQLERERDQFKAINKIAKNKNLPSTAKIAKLVETFKISEHTAAKLLEPDFAGRIGIASYKFTNMGATIRKEKARLSALVAAKTPTGVAVANTTAETATARAGLFVTATMTTPSRPGKKPRPVWNVIGNLAFWRPLLVDNLGGTWYRGVVSFWEDPADAIEAACLECESDDVTRRAAGVPELGNGMN